MVSKSQTRPVLYRNSNCFVSSFLKHYFLHVELSFLLKYTININLLVRPHRTYTLRWMNLAFYIVVCLAEFEIFSYFLSIFKAWESIMKLLPRMQEEGTYFAILSRICCSEFMPATNPSTCVQYLVNALHISPSVGIFKIEWPSLELTRVRWTVPFCGKPQRMAHCVQECESSL